MHEPTSAGWTTTSIATRFLIDLLDEAGRPVDDVLSGAGVARAALSAPDFALPLDAFRELWARAAAVRPDIGITLVERFPEGQMHILAHLALRSANVEAALGDVCRYATVTSASDRLELVRDADAVRFGYASRAPQNPWMAEHYLSMAVVFLTRATGRALPILAVELAAPRQAPLASYRRRFGVDPRFEAGRTALAFDGAALAWPLLTHDAYLHDILERVAQARSPAAPDALLDTVRRAIAQSVLEGRTPAMDAVAASCGLARRALRERLSSQRTTFRQLLDEVRRDLAREHLARGLSVNETAYLLGFSEPAAFQHACKRWFDTSAGKLRRAASS